MRAAGTKVPPTATLEVQTYVNERSNDSAVGKAEKRRLLDMSKCLSCDSADTPSGSEPEIELFCSSHHLGQQNTNAPRHIMVNNSGPSSTTKIDAFAIVSYVSAVSDDSVDGSEPRRVFD